jgi:hypothetical protein
MVERGSGDVRAVARSVRVREYQADGWSRRLTQLSCRPRRLRVVCGFRLEWTLRNDKEVEYKCLSPNPPRGHFLFSTPPKIVKLNFPYCDLKNYL